MFRHRIATLSTVCLVVLGLAAHAQTTGSIRGQVAGPGGEVKPGALVVVAGSMLLGSTGSGASVSDTVVAMQTRPQMVELYSEDCPICQQMKPVVQSVREECAGRQVDIRDLDVSQPANRHLIGQYRVVGVPTFLFLDNRGREVARLVGRQSEDSLQVQVSELRADLLRAR